MPVLVTGGAGFIGSHVVDYLVREGHKVIVLDDFSGGFRKNLNPAAQWIDGSVSNEEVVDSIFSVHNIEYVYHIAAYAAEGLSHFIRGYNYKNNLLGSMYLINNAVRHHVRCFVFTSSIAVYGAGQTPMTEHTVPIPEDPYGISKYAVELDLAAAKKMFGLDYIIFRPHNVYGERQNIGDPYRNVIGIFMNKILQNLPCPIFGDGSQTRAFTHIADVAPTIAKSIAFHRAYNQTFNIGADVRYTINALAREVQTAMGSEVGTVHLPPRNEVQDAFSDHKKVREFFGAPPGIILPLGLKRMAEWVKREGAQKGKGFGKLEITRGLPESWRRL